MGIIDEVNIIRYIGGKRHLLNSIVNEIQSLTENVRTVIDIFSGSGIVSTCLKNSGYNVIGNDFLYFAYVLGRGTVALSKIPRFENLGIDNPLDCLNSLKLGDTDISVDDCFIYQNYSPHNDTKRMYFQENNALKIDLIRLTIEKWKHKALITDDEYFYLLASLVGSVPYVSNIAGVYGAYLKHWDARTYNLLELKPPDIIENNVTIEFYNEDCCSLLPKISGDLLYADPPYNSRQYLPNYHILETVARYDYPAIHGVTGMRDYSNQRSDFCVARKVEDAFRNMIEEANVRYILISYNNEGLLSTDRLKELCQEYAIPNTFHLTEINYRRYNNIGTTPGGVVEQLYFFEKIR